MRSMRVMTLLVTIVVVATTLAGARGAAGAQQSGDGTSPDGRTTLTAVPSVGLESGEELRLVTSDAPLPTAPGAVAVSLQCGFMMRAAREFVCSPQHGDAVLDFGGVFDGTLEARRAFAVGEEVAECDVTVKCIALVLVISAEWEILGGATEILSFAPGGTPSVGCAAPPAAGTTSQTIDTNDGRTRAYHVHVPDAAAGRASALVLNFHGYTSDISGQLALSGLSPFADDAGFILVTPQGEPDARGINHWNLAPGGVVDDLAFVDELLDELEQTQCVDRDRVFSTGMSNGGYFSGLLACERSDRIAAIATVTGLFRAGDCNSSRRVPLLHMHGTDDAIVPFGAMEVGVEAWADDLGCAADPVVTAIGEDVLRRSYQGCRGAGVEFYVVNGGGHTWPSSPVADFVAPLLGYTTFDISANELMWQWFQANPLR
ncbi:MAG: hypothetical protein HKN26_03250 [Acidimicrobiales bacterium]|nr:hypothetical protein [Acidimicrobiales bacterium]